MSNTSYTEQATQHTQLTGTFTGSIVKTREFDKYRQGAEYFAPTHPKYLAQGIVKIVKQNLVDSAQIFPQDIFPQQYFIDNVGAEDNTEPHGFWHEGFLEPFTIRDEITFNSIESPFLAHSIKGAVSEHVDLIEQLETREGKLDIAPRIFFDSGTISKTTTSPTTAAAAAAAAATTAATTTI